MQLNNPGLARLTATHIAAIRPKAEEFDLVDPAVPALILRVGPSGRAILRGFVSRNLTTLIASSHQMAVPGVQRLMDYQDAAYANFYLDRLTSLRALDDGRNDWLFTREAARYLALCTIAPN